MIIKKVVPLIVLFALVRDITAKNKEKKIGLEDIEQDNLRSEREKQESESRVELLKTAAQTSQNRQPYRQYAVEEEQTSSPYLVYPSNQNYEQVQPDPEQERRIVYQHEQSNSIEENPNEQQQQQQQHIPPGYLPVTMQFIYLPQIYPNQAYYQSEPQQAGITYAQEQHQEEKSPVSQVNYLQVPPTSPTAPAYENYAQYEDNKINQNEDLNQNYADVPQQYVYVNAAPQEEQNSYKYQSQSPTIDVNLIPQYVSAVRQIIHSQQNGEAGHIPRVVPHYEPQISSPVYSHISGNLPSTYDPSYQLSVNHLKPQVQQHHQQYNPYPFQRPSSLLDSYIPSSLQVAYLKSGLSKDLASTYDAIVSNGLPKFLEGGFTPNQMFTDSNGLVSYGHFKRSV